MGVSLSILTLAYVVDKLHATDIQTRKNPADEMVHYTFVEREE
jgi:hypothetical protein